VTRYLILGLLRDGRARHGYALAKDCHAYGVRMSVGNAYCELRRLVAKGWVRPAVNPPGSDPRRIPYQITDAGCRAFDAWMSAPAPRVTTEHRDELSLRAFLIAQTGSRVAGEVLDDWQEQLLLRRRLFEREAARAPAGCEGGAFRVSRLLLARRLRHVTVDLDFVAEFRRAYRTWEVARARTDPAPRRPAASRPDGHPEPSRRSLGVPKAMGNDSRSVQTRAP
jgi:DNA-binding PadR family transcriptional regulator